MRNIKKLLSSMILFAVLLSLIIPTHTTAKTSSKTNPFVSSLSGKLIYTDGDGTTIGTKLSVNKKMGMRPTYSALTAYRNNARYVTKAMSGTTLGDIKVNGKDYKGYASTVYNRYKKAPSGADYITLFFGWNDNTLGKIMYKEKWLKNKYGKKLYFPRTASKIGKKGFANKKQVKACDKASGYINDVKYIGNDYFNMQYIGNSKSKSTKTFWGAYKFVLDYLTTSSKYVNTKIGLIVPFGTTEAMRTAVRQIAKKYNLIYLDLYSDNLPLFYGKESTNKEVTAKMCAENRAKYFVDASHPNSKGHKLLSEIYEKWLKSKLIYTDGDSITRGAKLSVDPERGWLPTYAALTAKRNGTHFINNAISRTTIGDVRMNGEDRKGFASSVYNRYKKVPAGVDYLTLMFGWNDDRVGPVMFREKWLKNQYGEDLYYPRKASKIGEEGFANAEQTNACDNASGYVNGVEYTGDEYYYMQYIGTSDSKDTETFWGAYNTVLNYYKTNKKYKNTKIGIIVPYGTTTVMRNAVRQIAKKHKVACLDLYDDNLPLFYGKEPTNTSVTTEMCTENQTQYLADGVHPNDAGHELLSMIYEDWLKTL